MFREMGELEVKIRGIDKVRMISIYELTGIKDDPGHGIGAISVLYGKEDQINLCELDAGFDLLVDRVFEIYNELTDKNSVMIDDRTVKILQSGWSYKSEDFLEKYYQAEPTEVPRVAFESELSRRIMPIVEYILDGIYKMLGIKYEITGSKAGWRGAGVIYGLLNKTRVVSGIRIIQNNYSEYEVKLLNFVEMGRELTIYITISNQKIILEYSTEYQNIHGTGIYDLGFTGYTETHEVFRDGKKIFYDSRSSRGLEPVELSENEIKLIPWQSWNKADEDPDSSGKGERADVVVTLPWKDTVYVLKREKKENDSCKVNEFMCTYLYRKSVYSESRCWTGIQCKGTGFALRPSSVIMLQMGLTNDQNQTYFVPHMGTHKERFRKKLEGRYFTFT